MDFTAFLLIEEFAVRDFSDNSQLFYPKSTPWDFPNNNV